MTIPKMKLTLGTLMSIMASGPALSEVCDKMRPAWSAQSGPVNQADDLRLFLAEPLGLAALAFAALCLLLRRTWFTVPVIILFISIVTLNLAAWLGADGAFAFAVGEGCRTTPILTSTALITLAVGLAVVARTPAGPGPNPLP